VLPIVPTPENPCVVTETVFVDVHDNVVKDSDEKALQVVLVGFAVRVIVGFVACLDDNVKVEVAVVGVGMLLFAVSVIVVVLVWPNGGAVMETVQATPGRTNKLFPVVPPTETVEFESDVLIMTLQSLS
jgi:hypothetical protein